LLITTVSTLMARTTVSAPLVMPEVPTAVLTSMNVAQESTDVNRMTCATTPLAVMHVIPKTNVHSEHTLALRTLNVSTHLEHTSANVNQDLLATVEHVLMWTNVLLVHMIVTLMPRVMMSKDHSSVDAMMVSKAMVNYVKTLMNVNKLVNALPTPAAPTILVHTIATVTPAMCRITMVHVMTLTNAVLDLPIATTMPDV
jgi:hypothetical protein